MDHDQSPDHCPPDHSNNNDMAALVASGNAHALPQPQLAKRYRPAPAKTFQCRGYGDCRMVFSRSEHLARHIRKHTGERPFSCHCGKQFSRLDNLRQHAQTVHADKQDQNERMMRDLTSLHATMAAANKVGGSRAPRRAPPPPPLPGLSMGGGHAGAVAVQGELAPSDAVGLVKQEEGVHMPRGYDTDVMWSHSPGWASQPSELEMQQHAHIQHQQQHHHQQRQSAQPSFREASQAQQQQPFLAPNSNFRQPYYDAPRPSSSSSRPPTSSGQSLPPLAVVVSSAALPSPPLPSGSGSGYGTQAFPFPTLPHRRPGTASRPGTAPGGGGGASAAFFNDGPPGSSSGKFSTYNSLLGSSNNSLLHAGFGATSSSGRSGSSQGLFAYMANFHNSTSASTGGAPASTHSDGGSPTGADTSPFYFQPPALEHTSTSPPASNPRKRAFNGPDGPFAHDAPAGREGGVAQQQQQLGGATGGLLGFGSDGLAGLGVGGYEYGTESRPQSRRLSVMELCNDDAQRQQQANQATLALVGLGSGAGAGSGGDASGERPTTATGLVTSASALHIFDGDSDGSEAAVHRYGGATGYGRTNSVGYDTNANGNGSGSGSGSGGASPNAPGSVYGDAAQVRGRVGSGSAASGSGSVSGVSLPGGYANPAGLTPAQAVYASSHSPAPSAHSVHSISASASAHGSGGSHSPPGYPATPASASASFYAASPALSVHTHGHGHGHYGHHGHGHHGHPTPTPSPLAPGMLSYGGALAGSPNPSYAHGSPNPTYAHGTSHFGAQQQQHLQQLQQQQTAHLQEQAAHLQEQQRRHHQQAQQQQQQQQQAQHQQHTQHQQHAQHQQHVQNQQQQAQYAAYVQHSPSFSGTGTPSVASYASPRSPASGTGSGSGSDASGGGAGGEPFSPYLLQQQQFAAQQRHQQQMQYAGQQQQQQQYARRHSGPAGSGAGAGTSAGQQQRVSPVQYPGMQAELFAAAAAQQQQQQAQAYAAEEMDERYAYEQHAQRYASHGHGHGHGQHAPSVSPHATPTFGMRA